MNQVWLVWVWVHSRGKGVPVCLSIHPLCPSVSLSSSTGKPRGGRGQTIWQMEGTIGPRGACLHSPLTLCSKPPTFITWPPFQLDSKAITEPHRGGKKIKNDRVISLQTVKGTKACFASLLFWKRGIRGMRKEMFPLSWTCTVHAEFKLPNVYGVRTAKARYVAALT